MPDEEFRPLSPDPDEPSEAAIEGSLRPRRLDEYIGQNEVKASLDVLLQAAKGRGEAADHVLLYGPPGLGKTTLSTIIARELGVNVRYTSGPAVERAGDLAAILTALDERDVLFIDEIHRLNRAVEEILYPAMEDFALDVMIGKGPSARSLRLSLKPFTVVGATTRAGRISGPLRDRFGATYRLDFYSEDDLTAIVRRSAGILGVDVEPTPRAPSPGAAGARRASSTGCCAGSATTRRCTATAASRETAVIDAMKILDIDDLGLDTTDRKLLAAIIQKFASRAGRRPGARRGPRRGVRDDRGRLRAVPAAPRASSTGRRRAASPPTPRASTWRASGSRSRRRAAPSPTSRRCGTRPPVRATDDARAVGRADRRRLVIVVVGDRAGRARRPIPFLGRLPGDIRSSGPASAGACRSGR